MREIAYRITKSLFIASILGFFGSLLMGISLPVEVQKPLGTWLQQRFPCWLASIAYQKQTGPNPLSPYFTLCLIISLPTLIATMAMTQIYFRKREDQYGAEKLSDPNKVRRGWSCLIAAIAFFVGFTLFPTLFIPYRALLSAAIFACMYWVASNSILAPTQDGKTDANQADVRKQIARHSKRTADAAAGRTDDGAER